MTAIIEPDAPLCEECLAETRRVCNQCGRRICRACATHHRMGLVVYADLPEEDQPSWCRPLTEPEKRALDRLPLSREQVARATHQDVYERLQRDRFVRWTDADVLVRTR